MRTVFDIIKTLFKWCVITVLLIFGLVFGYILLWGATNVHVQGHDYYHNGNILDHYQLREHEVLKGYTDIEYERYYSYLDNKLGLSLLPEQIDYDYSGVIHLNQESAEELKNSCEWTLAEVDPSIRFKQIENDFIEESEWYTTSTTFFASSFYFDGEDTVIFYIYGI